MRLLNNLIILNLKKINQVLGLLRFSFVDRIWKLSLEWYNEIAAVPLDRGLSKAPEAVIKPRGGWPVTIFLMSVIVSSCLPKKVPLRYAERKVEIVSAHWYENEKVAYFFYRINDANRNPDLNLIEWKIANNHLNVESPSKRNSLKVIGDNYYQSLKNSKSVHNHFIQTCGTELCGSFSLPMLNVPDRLSLRVKYHVKSPLFSEAESSFIIHKEDGTPNELSNLAYGIFDNSNSYVQIRNLSNFGNPSSDEIKNFGMVRNFRIKDYSESDWNKFELDELLTDSKTPTLFSIKKCDQRNKNKSEILKKEIVDFSEEIKWLSDSFSNEKQFSGLCFDIEFLNQEDRALTSGSLIARRNPVVQSENIKLRTPLQDSIKIPLVLSYCPRSLNQTPMTSEIFLEYQKFILGFPNEAIDLCFEIGNEESFRLSLRGLLIHKILDLQSSGSALKDFVFAVVLNHRLSSEFQVFQEIVMEELDALIASHRQALSPRLIGAFVYDSDGNFSKPQLAKKNIIWCPQNPEPEHLDSKKPQDSIKAYDGGVNCLVNDAKLLKSSLLNFLIPMGAFPSLQTYEKYFHDYGDKGFIRNPQFQVQNVAVNALTTQDETSITTFFESNSLSLKTGEALRTCYENDESHLISSIRFKKAYTEEPSQNFYQLQSEANSIVEDTNYFFGILWEYPFWGGINYTQPLSGTIIGIIPFEKDSHSKIVMGDEKWQRPVWNLEPMLQKCIKYCDHPYFDESGVYQLNLPWKSQYAFGCPKSKIPIYGVTH